jgi:peptidyl-prolyl cis-trans isomerase D
MREYFRSLKVILVVIILAFVVTSVVYFGSSAISGSMNRSNAVGTVNGEEIPAERYQRMQANLVDQYERAAKQRMTPEVAEQLGINQQVINDLVNDAVIVQTAAREGVRVTDDELRAFIQGMKEFQEDGRFSRDRYMQILRRARFEPGEFESEMRRALVKRKMENLVRDGVKVSAAEVQEAYALRNDRVRAAWASLEIQPLMAGVTVQDSEIEPYVKGHQAQLTEPERRRVQYVVVDPKQFVQPVPEQDIEAYYKDHGAEFERPRRLQVAHVLVRVPPVGGSDAENQAKAKVDAVIKRAQAGEDFAKLAREVSEDKANAAQGGDLGVVGPGDLVPQFEQAAFAMKKGEISAAPVRTPFGYHAIKVLDIKEGGKTPLKEATPKIKERLAADRSELAARTKADAVRTALLGAKDFMTEAKTLGFEPKEVTISRGQPLPGVERDAGLEENIFTLAVGGTSAPAKTPSGLVVIKVVRDMPAGVPPLAEIKTKVIDAIKRDRAEALAMERAKALVAALDKGGDFASTAKEAGFATGELPLFSRAEPPKERAMFPGAVLLAALQTAAGRVSEPVRAGSAVYVVKTLERQAPDQQNFERQRAEIERQTLDQKRNEVWDSWIQSRRASMKVDLAAGLTTPTQRR